MKRETVSSRGVRVAEIYVFAQCGDGKISDLLNKIEDEFYGAAKRYAMRLCDKVSKMSAAERRRVRCEKISLVCEIRECGDANELVARASIQSGAGTLSAERWAYIETKTGRLIKKPRGKKERAPSPKTDN